MVHTHEEPHQQLAREQNISRTTSVRIQPGDSLWKIAKKYLRGGKDWMLLAAYNPQVRDAMRLRVGMSVVLPEEALRFRPPKRILVQHGDSLWKLAKVYIGDGNRWSCLGLANPDVVDAGLIYAGQTLTIPVTCESPPSAEARHLTASSQPFPSPIESSTQYARRMPIAAPFR
jgi:nucleoid-associated protein YgaU